MAPPILPRGLADGLGDRQRGTAGEAGVGLRYTGETHLSQFVAHDSEVAVTDQEDRSVRAWLAVGDQRAARLGVSTTARA